ncbi:hypothetical protein CY34DRAFT_185108 [Suillus luteus UH-Slu-Lm8-n1]|uniref:Uncharacterized protein n=1 Tax=Suillus luteus UH-Slu-Lm8-n1 TaxID=930992 RepID=A0A0D0AV45_9AGAM|nr:hypothetical protein CY34DRAFT_185108 [Suillus luteus UH-Slu-Lm8-n1]
MILQFERGTDHRCRFSSVILTIYQHSPAPLKLAAGPKSLGGNYLIRGYDQADSGLLYVHPALQSFYIFAMQPTSIYRVALCLFVSSHILHSISFRRKVSYRVSPEQYVTPQVPFAHKQLYGHICYGSKQLHNVHMIPRTTCQVESTANAITANVIVQRPLTDIADR